MDRSVEERSLLLVDRRCRRTQDDSQVYGPRTWVESGAIYKGGNSRPTEEMINRSTPSQL